MEAHVHVMQIGIALNVPSKCKSTTDVALESGTYQGVLHPTAVSLIQSVATCQHVCWTKVTTRTHQEITRCGDTILRTLISWIPLALLMDKPLSSG